MESSMSTNSSHGLIRDATPLLDRLHASQDPYYGAGSMSTSVYDTAWVSMITKTRDRTTTWLFPKSFFFVLDSQSSEGGWNINSSQTDSILTSMAALLSLCKHNSNPLQLRENTPNDLRERILKAVAFLERTICQWDPTSVNSVGFELLVPAHFELLETEGYRFTFSGYKKLMQIREKKLQHFDISSMYDSSKSTALHSLEAFVGMVDFDRVSHHKTLGSMMASPSATAAYMIHNPDWDEESEKYLDHVFAKGAGDGNGGFPSAFPSNIFEISWTISTLLQNGFSKDDLPTSLNHLAGTLSEAYETGCGLVGFAPCLEPDADDTAQCITALTLLGKSVSPKPLIGVFGREDYFKTFLKERDASLSTNCNVLIALTAIHSPSEYSAIIIQLAKYICRCWEKGLDGIKDKWNSSVNYSIMLVSRALTSILVLWGRGVLPDLTLEFVQTELSLVLLQALIRTLRSQSADGSWNCVPEITAYSIISLNILSSIPLHTEYLEQIQTAITNGRRFIQEKRNLGRQPDLIWIEKVAYGSQNLNDAYILAALRCQSTPIELHSSVGEGLRVPSPHLLKRLKFYKLLPMFATTPGWILKVSIIEGTMFSHTLKAKCSKLFQGVPSGKETHFEIVPFAWTAANNSSFANLGSEILSEMMIVSALAFEVDKFIETHITSLPLHFRKLVKSSLGDQQIKGCKLESINGNDHTQAGANDNFSRTDSTQSSPKNDSIHAEYSTRRIKRSSMCVSGDQATTRKRQRRPTPISNDTEKAEAAFRLILTTLNGFLEFYLHHPAVQKASDYLKSQLRLELKAYISAHITQTEDSERLKIQTVRKSSPGFIKTLESPAPSLHSWVNSTSGNHTAGPFAFAFFLCLLDSESPGALPTSASFHYISQDFSRSLASLCRLYNDYGSLARDVAEDNLNSVNFPEFSGFEGENTNVQPVKDDLMYIAEYTRRRVEAALAALEKIVPMNVFEKIKGFYRAADVFGQMYVLKDLTPGIDAGKIARSG